MQPRINLAREQPTVFGGNLSFLYEVRGDGVNRHLVDLCEAFVRFFLFASPFRTVDLIGTRSDVPRENSSTVRDGRSIYKLEGMTIVVMLRAVKVEFDLFIPFAQSPLPQQL